jgi:hypothetical protein
MTFDKRLGVPAYEWYEPYDARFQVHLKTLLRDGRPVFCRLYPGVDYPMEEAVLHRVVDREGHVIVLVGYDDVTDDLLAADPWNAQWGGTRSEVIRIPIIDAPSLIVDCCAEASGGVVPWIVKLDVMLNPLGGVIARGMIDYCCPTPFNALKSHVNPLVVKLELPEGVTILAGSAALDLGVFRPNEVRIVEWPLGIERSAYGSDLTLRAMGLVEGKDPYDYYDLIGETASTRLPTYVMEQVSVLAGAVGG